MKAICLLVFLSVISLSGRAKPLVYQGSTPAHRDVRVFLNISLTDSIDFIKWHLAIDADRYELSCKYGLAKGGTDGFTNEKQARFSGKLAKDGHHYILRDDDRNFYILQLNSNLLQLVDRNKKILVGNGGYSYTLNTDTPQKTDQLNLSSKQVLMEPEASFQGRTPCQELATMMGLNKSGACDKMKWYIIFFADPGTGKPTHYLKGGRAYKRETMTKGKWETYRGKDGRVMYKLDPDKGNFATYLVKVDDNTLFFTDADGNLLVGNKNFSYTLNRVPEKLP